MPAKGEAPAQLVIPPLRDGDGLRPERDARIVRLSGDTMGTSWSVYAAVGDRIDSSVLDTVITDGFDLIIAQMSQWDPQSELSRYNAAQPGSWHDISAQFGIVMRAAVELAEASGGLFNPTVGGLSEAWGFGVAGPHASSPDQGEIELARPKALHPELFDPSRGRLFQPGGVRLDLSGIAKGFAVDYTVARLKRAGVRHMLVEIGGELRGEGVRPDGQPWWVDVEAAPDESGGPVRIALSNWATATTGHYLRRRGHDGQSWSHTIDPRNGRPVDDGIASVSVLHPSCMAADGVATLLAVMGPDAGIEFAEAQRLAARFVVDGAVRCSRPWMLYCE